MIGGIDRFPLGAHLIEGDCSCFRVWAPLAHSIELHLLEASERRVPFESTGHGYFRTLVDHVAAGARYLFRLDGVRELPDPASRFQPEGVHGPSAVVPHEFPWTDAVWSAPPLRDYVIYELHVGTFTPQGTFDAVADHLEYLRDLGITAVELMPVAEFPGARNWGYDGVFPFAVHSSYGGPTGLKRLVDACHRAGLAVILDVVYNHVGPEGNSLSAFGHYFTDRYQIPWGAALNFDGPYSDEVREFFIQNALQWTGEFHIDALRLDAVHALHDASARPFLQELACRVHEAARADDRTVYLIAESDLGDPRVIRPPALGGHGLDAQWLDDFHHALHALLTRETAGYYRDFGTIDQLAQSYREGFVYSGQYSRYRMRRHGAPAPDVRPEQFVVCSQNHDQVGNRCAGDRLTATLGLEQLKLAAAAVLLSPFTPLVFMGEEYGESAPFPYFISHDDSRVIEIVRAGRARECAHFGWPGAPVDPQATETFTSARLDHRLREHGHHRTLLAFYRRLAQLRREYPILTTYDTLETSVTSDGLLVSRQAGGVTALLTLNYADHDATFVLADRWRSHSRTRSRFRCILDSAARQWGGPDAAEGARSTVTPDVLCLRPHAAMLLVTER